MTDRLWAPWRLEYIERADEQEGCVFCNALGTSGDDLVVHRGRLAFVLLNRFPYTAGHLMVAPVRHVGDYGDLDDDEALEIHALTQAALAALAGTGARTATTSAGTSAARRAPESSTTSTCTSSRAGAVTRTSCRCSRTSA